MLQTTHDIFSNFFPLFGMDKLKKLSVTVKNTCSGKFLYRQSPIPGCTEKVYWVFVFAHCQATTAVVCIRRSHVIYYELVLITWYVANEIAQVWSRDSTLKCALSWHCTSECYKVEIYYYIILCITMYIIFLLLYYILYYINYIYSVTL